MSSGMMNVRMMSSALARSVTAGLVRNVTSSRIIPAEPAGMMKFTANSASIFPAAFFA